MIDKIELWYNLIVNERDQRLKLAKETNNEYQFNVAHGLTESLRLFDKAGLNEELNKFEQFCDSINPSK